MPRELAVSDYDTESTGQKVLFDDVVKEVLGDEGGESLTCADMDGTLFENDLGVLVFLEKLSDPTFWTLSEEQFRSLLLPEKYQRLMNTGAMGEGVEGIDRADCILVLMLWEDIVDLYKLQKVFVEKDHKTMGLEDPLVNEFARKMIEFDKYFMKMDSVLVHRPETNGQLLMRTRFFAGKNQKHVVGLTKKALDRRKKDNVTLAVYPENRLVVDQRVENLPDLYCEREVRDVLDIREMIERLVLKNGSEARVVTTNLQQIADTAIMRTSYDEFFRRNSAIGSTLKRDDDGTLHPKMSRGPVIGDMKARVASMLMMQTRRRLLVAMGDSLSDGPMGMLSLSNGGLFVAVGKDYESTRRKFAPLIEAGKKLGIPNIGKRVLLVDY